MTESVIPANPAATSTPGTGPAKRRVSKKKIALGVVGAVLVLGAFSNANKDETVGTVGAGEAAVPAAEAPAAPAAGAPAVVAAEEWTVAGWADRFAAYDFAGPTDSPLLDGTPRQLMQRASDSAMVEAIGDPGALDRVSLVVGVSADTGEDVGELMGAFLNTYAPGSRQEVTDKLTPDADFTVDYAGGSVRVQSMAASDGALITMTVDRD